MINKKISLSKNAFRNSNVLRLRLKDAVLSLYHNCDTTTIRVRSKLQHALDSTAIWLRYDHDEKNDVHFCSRQMEAGVHDMS